MYKKVLVLLIVISILMTSVFATSSNLIVQDSKVSLETQVGYSTDVRKFQFKNDSSLYSIKTNQHAFSIGEKLTFYTDLGVKFTTSATFNFVIDAAFQEDKLKDSVTLSSGFYQNSFKFFLGATKDFFISEEVSINVALGPNIIYYFDNSDINNFVVSHDSDSSFYTYGFEGNVNFNYKLSSAIRLTLGVSVSYNPICFGGMIDELKYISEETSKDYTDYVYSITPTIGLVYIL